MSVLAVTLALLMGTHVAVAENTPCVSPEILSLNDNFQDGFHLGHIYQDFWGNEDKELVLVNAKDKELFLEVYTSDIAVNSCNPDISLKLGFTRYGDIWNNSAIVSLGMREYGFSLWITESQSIGFEEFWYAGTRGLEHSHGQYTLRLQDTETLQLIGYDDAEIGVTYPSTSESINFLSEKYVVTCSPGVLQAQNGFIGEHWGQFDMPPIFLRDGDKFDDDLRREAVSALTGDPELNAFLEECSENNQ
ncbi:hypothetical protein LSUCC1028_00445 [Rhodobacterales bacterium LSUCC1028]|nr:hypothetical protein [Rhodobacterales bacterium LSUCC1028]